MSSWAGTSVLVRETVGGRVHPYRQYQCSRRVVHVSPGDMRIGQSTGMF